MKTWAYLKDGVPLEKVPLVNECLTLELAFLKGLLTSRDLVGGAKT